MILRALQGGGGGGDFFLFTSWVGMFSPPQGTDKRTILILTCLFIQLLIIIFSRPCTIHLVFYHSSLIFLQLLVLIILSIAHYNLVFYLTKLTYLLILLVFVISRKNLWMIVSQCLSFHKETCSHLFSFGNTKNSGNLCVCVCVCEHYTLVVTYLGNSTIDWIFI